MHEGIYNENVVINKSLTIQGTDKENVIIDGTGLSGKGVSVEADYVTIKNLTIRNFKSGNWPWGIELPLELSTCVFIKKFEREENFILKASYRLRFINR